MRISTLASVAALSLAVAVSPIAGFATAAQAQGGNGGGNGGGSGGGHGGGNGGEHGKSGDHRGGDGKEDKSGENKARGKEKKAEGNSIKRSSAELKSLYSLRRNYHAYLNTSDPKMAAVSAYAIAYAQYELDNGTEPSVTDPVLGDAALVDALASATKTGEVSPEVFEEAKAILGIGDERGKIDEIRESLRATTASDD